MRKNLLYLFVIFCFTKVISQIPNFNWVKGFNTSLIYPSTAWMTADKNSGDVYITGGFTATADFDPGPGTATLTPAGPSDIFIAKYSITGQYQWAFQLGTPSGGEQGYAIKTDNIGNVYVTGMFNDGAFPTPIDFDPGPGTATFIPMGQNAYVAKYNSSGQYQWAFNIGGFSYGTDIEIDASNNVFVEGVLSVTADFDPGPGTYNVSPPGFTINTFLAKYTSNGTFLAAFAIGSTNGPVDPNAMAIDCSGNIYITGNFGMGTGFSPWGGPPTPPFVANGDFYIAKYDNNLSGCFWAIGFGSNGTDYGTDIDVDPAGNVYVNGLIQGVCDLDPGPGTATLSPPALPGFSGILAKYNTNGQYQWAFLTDRSLSVKADAAGNIYSVGTFSGTADFDPSASVANLTSNGSYDAYIAKYTTNGNYSYAFNLGGTANESATGLAVSPNFGIKVLGSFSGITDFDPSTSTYTLANITTSDMFIASFTSTTIPSLVNISTSNTLICSGQTATLNVTGANTYTWSTSSSASVIAVSPTITTSYSVIGTNSVGCQYTASITQSVSACTGIEENHDSYSFSIYPNPTSGEIILLTEPKENLSLEIYNTLGQLTLQEKITDTKTKINLNEQANGVYFVKVLSNDGLFLKKIIKE